MGRSTSEIVRLGKPLDEDEVVYASLSSPTQQVEGLLQTGSCNVVNLKSVFLRNPSIFLKVQV